MLDTKLEEKRILLLCPHVNEGKGSSHSSALVAERDLIVLLSVSSVRSAFSRRGGATLLRPWNRTTNRCDGSAGRGAACWQPRLLALQPCIVPGISGANRGSFVPQTRHTNIAPVIAHLSLSRSQRNTYPPPHLLNEIWCNGQVRKSSRVKWNWMQKQRRQGFQTLASWAYLPWGSSEEANYYWWLKMSEYIQLITLKFLHWLL